MAYRVEELRVPVVHTAVIRDSVRPEELSKFVPAACGEVWSFIRAAGLPRPGRHVAVYLDAQGMVEVGAEVSAPFVGDGRVHCSSLPHGRVVTTTHLGPYPRLFHAHAAVRSWCAEQGHRLAGACWEVYGHWDKSWGSDPSQIRTDVFYLLDER